MVEKHMAVQGYEYMCQASRCRLFYNRGYHSRTKRKILINPLKRFWCSDGQQQVNYEDGRNQVDRHRRHIEDRFPVLLFVCHAVPFRLILGSGRTISVFPPFFKSPQIGRALLNLSDIIGKGRSHQVFRARAPPPKEKTS